MKIIGALAMLVLLGGALFFTNNFSPSDSSYVETHSETTEPTESVETKISIPPELISSAKDDAAVFIIEPKDGAIVSSPLVVRFGINNMEVAPAGTNQPYSGHHHLLIDLDTLPDMGSPLPATEQIVHYGKGQTETEIELAPGEHSLQLLLGNYVHIPHDPPVISEKIHITVK